jgi:hypothetical protein
MKKLLFLALAISVVGCQSPAPAKIEPKYTISFVRDSLNSVTRDIDLYTQIDTISAANDTVAYLTAVKKFYNYKMKGREELSLDQWKSFTIADKNGIDLKTTLPTNVTEGIENQVKNSPEVSRYLEDVMRDSLPY